MSMRFLARAVVSFVLAVAVLASGAYPLTVAFGAPASGPHLQASPIDRADQIREVEPDLEDDFYEITDLWNTSYDGDTASYYKAGAFHISINTDNLVAWETGDIDAADFLVEVDVSHYDGPLVNEGGLLFRYVDSENFYLFTVSSDGLYAVKRIENDESTTLVDWTESDALETGERSINRLMVLAEGDQFAFFINEELVDEVVDDTFTEGSIGLIAGSLDEYEVDIAFDDFALWKVEASSEPAVRIPGRRIPAQPTPEPEDEPLSVEERLDSIRSGEPAFVDDFSAGAGEWDSESTDETIYDFVDGTFYFRVIPVDWVSYSQTDTVYTDFLAEVDTEHSFGPVAVEYGLYFRNVDGNNYYYFGISANGQFNLWKRIDGEWEEILSWTESDALEVGEGAFNRIGVLAEGSNIALLANDVVLAEVEDDSIAAGALGVFVRTYDEEDVEIAFDNVEVWELAASQEEEPVTTVTEDALSPEEVEARIDEIVADEPAISEDFRTDNGQWGTSSSEDAVVEVRRRQLHISVDSADWITWSLFEVEQGDFLLEADVEAITSPLDGNYGVIFRVLDSDNFYLFRISPRGTFSLMKKVAGTWTTLTDWTLSDAIDTDEGAVNRLGVFAEGPQLAVLVNGEIVAQAVDEDLTDGQIGLAAGVYAEPGLEVVFDNVSLWDLRQ